VRRSILIVDDEELIRRSLRMAFEGAGYAVTLAATAAEALAELGDDPPDCVVVDLRLGDQNGLDVLREARERHPTLKAIVITAHGDVDAAVRALRLGAFDFIKKPFDLEEVLAAVENALRTDQLEQQVAYYARQSAERAPRIVVDSPVMQAAWRTIEKVARQPVPVVLVVGETGTGKELAARALHAASPQHAGPFIELNCSAIPETLVESELFGHERGAFSDAREQKRGLVELADGGTLFLDEVGELPAAAQAKLLRFVETFEFRRVGGTKQHAVSCRIVAATNRDLEDDGAFRRDLYYRLGGVTIRLPPLRERGDDVVVLARQFLTEFAQLYRKRLDGFTPEAEALLRAHRWPGNVRELRAAVSMAALMAEDRLVDPSLLGHVAGRQSAAPLPLPERLDDVMTIDALELAYVTRVLTLCAGNKVMAAQKLGIARQTLARWLAEPSPAP
jgi:two-component system response regulator AtoC